MFRITSLGISFLLVALLIAYINTKLFGVWLTILSLITFIDYLDIGMGMGLRNKLTESLVKGKIEHSKSLVSTTYGVLILISAFAFFIFLLISKMVNWSLVFNVEKIYNEELQLVMIIVMIPVFINFIFSLNNHVAYANQESSFPGFKELLFQSFFFIGGITAFFMSKNGNLFNLAIIYMISLVGSNLISSFYVFYRHRSLIPSPKFFRIKEVRGLISLSFQFFIIQIAALIIFTTDNLVITHVLGPNEVTNYNVIYKLFLPIALIHAMIITPLWSAFTESYEKSDFIWINRTFKKLFLYLVLFSLAIIVLVFSSKYIILLWLNDLSFYQVPLIIVMGILVFIMIWNNNYAYFLNGVSKLKIQLLTAIIGGFINIPISIFLAERTGSIGVALGSIISLSLFAIAGPLHVVYVLRNRYKEDNHGKIASKYLNTRL